MCVAGGAWKLAWQHNLPSGLPPHCPASGRSMSLLTDVQEFPSGGGRRPWPPKPEPLGLMLCCKGSLLLGADWVWRWPHTPVHTSLTRCAARL